MYITIKGDYENASMTLITHKDADYSNSTLRLLCMKSRKIDKDGKFSKWGELKFRFEISNNDMAYGSIGSYRSIMFDRSEFLSWLISMQQAVKSPDCYNNNIIVKRRSGKNDFVIKFAVSQKLNCNAILACIVSGQTSFSKIGIDGLLFNQFLLQMGKMAVDILNFEMEFDKSILMYKNNQNIEYQISRIEYQTQQNSKIIELLSNIDNNNNNNNNIEINSIVDTFAPSKTIGFFDKETIAEEKIEIINKQFYNIIDEKKEIIVEEEKIEIINMPIIDENDTIENNIALLEGNNSEFSNIINDNLDDTELDELFESRIENIENPPLIKPEVNNSKLLDYSIKNKTGIEMFSSIFSVAQKNFPSMQLGGITKYYNDILNDSNYFLPQCLEIDVNSLHYLSQLQYFNIISQYRDDEELSNFVDIPLYYHLLNDHSWKYDSVKNIFDLISIYVYMHKYSQLLKTRITNSIENKVIFTKCFRLIFEPVYLTYLLSLDLSNTKSLENTIFDHYKSLSNIDYFKDWNDKAKDYDLSLSTDKDIKNCISDLILYTKKLINVPLKINHDTFYNKKTIKLPYKNKFKCEHIFDIARLEGLWRNTTIDEQTFTSAIGQCKSDVSKDMIVFLKDSYLGNQSESDNILDTLIDNKKNKESSLYRFIKNNTTEEFKNSEKLLEYIKEISENDISFVELPEDINIYSIPDNILIAMSIWKPSQDFRIKQYSHLLKEIKSHWKTKTDIISEYIAVKQENKTEEKVKNDVDWGSFV